MVMELSPRQRTEGFLRRERVFDKLMDSLADDPTDPKILEQRQRDLAIIEEDLRREAEVTALQDEMAHRGLEALESVAQASIFFKRYGTHTNQAKRFLDTLASLSLLHRFR